MTNEQATDRCESQWIDSPTGDGWYWLEQLGELGPPTWVRAGVTGGASWLFEFDNVTRPLTGRVCPINERPKEGDA